MRRIAVLGALALAACTNPTDTSDVRREPLVDRCPGENGVIISLRGACLRENREHRAATTRLGCELDLGHDDSCRLFDEWVEVDSALHVAIVDAFRSAESCTELRETFEAGEQCKCDAVSGYCREF